MAEESHPLEDEDINRIVRGLDPIDWLQLQLLANLSPADRVLAGISVEEFARAALRGTFERRFPEMSSSELNMKILTYFTSAQIETK